MDAHNSEERHAVSTAPVPVHLRHGRKLIYSYLLALFFVGAITAVYSWQHQKVDNLNKRVSVLMGAHTSSVSSSQPTLNLVKDTGVSYPLSMPGKKVLTTIYVPGGMNLLSTSPFPSGGGPGGTLLALRSESWNDIIGYWQFESQGTMTNPSTKSPTGLLNISAVGQWENTADSVPIAYPAIVYPDKTVPAISGVMMSISDKQALVNQMKTETQKCASNSTTGFTTKDNVYNICYTLIHPQAAGGEWSIIFTGYAELNGSPVYMSAVASLPNNYQAPLDNYIQAFKNISTTVSNS